MKAKAPLSADGYTKRARRLQSWTIVTASLVAISAIGAIILPGACKPILGTVSALAALASVILNVLKSRTEDSARDALKAEEARTQSLLRAERERSALLLRYNVSEVLNSIDSLARREPAERPLEIAAVRQSAAVQTKEAVAATSVRAAYFRIDDPAAATRTMRPDKVASSPDRTDQFSAVFEESSGRNANVWAVVDGREPTFFVEDLAGETDPRIERIDRQYETFITAQVAAGGIAFGMLTVNALPAGSLVSEDQFVVEAIARLLGIAELLCLSTQSYGRLKRAAELRGVVQTSDSSSTVENET